MVAAAPGEKLLIGRLPRKNKAKLNFFYSFHFLLRLIFTYIKAYVMSLTQTQLRTNLSDAAASDATRFHAMHPESSFFSCPAQWRLSLTGNDAQCIAEIYGGIRLCATL
jgi:hypothetical protein